MDTQTEIVDLQAVVNLMTTDQANAQAAADAATAQIAPLQATAQSQGALADSLKSYIATIQGVIAALQASTGGSSG